MKTMGDRIKDLRLAAKMSQQDVADALTRMGFKLSQRGLSKLEANQVTKPQAATIRGLAKFFQADVEWIVTGIGTQSPVALLNPDESDLILLFRSLSPTARSYILGRARDMHRDEHEKPQPDGDDTHPSGGPGNHRSSH